MNAAEIVRTLEQDGITLSVVGGGIKVSSPRGKLREELLAQVRDHKDALCAFLAGVPAPEPASVPAGRADDQVQNPWLRDLEPKQLAAAEGQHRLATTGALASETREVTIELPDGGVVWIVPEPTGKARVEVTWPELGSDPLGCQARVRQILAAKRIFGGKLINYLPTLRPQRDPRGE